MARKLLIRAAVFLGGFGFVAGSVLFALAYFTVDIPDPNAYVNSQSTIIQYSNGAANRLRLWQAASPCGNLGRKTSSPRPSTSSSTIRSAHSSLRPCAPRLEFPELVGAHPRTSVPSSAPRGRPRWHPSSTSSGWRAPPAPPAGRRWRPARSAV